MKYLRTLLSIFFVICLVASMSTGVFAAEDGYMIRIFTGNQGTIGGETMVKDPESFSVSDVTLNADAAARYYVKGIRESGKDINPFYTDLPAVTHDTDFVVVYGLRTDLVTLTIRYENANGQQLAEDRILNCNKGDKPMVKALYIEGYAPNYNYITGTLTEDATWTFQYYAVTNGGAVVVVGGGGNAGGGIVGGGGNAGGGVVGGGGNAGGGVVGGGGNAGGGGGADITVQPPVTQDILDMDVPLADKPDLPEDNTSQSEEANKIIMKAGLILFIILIILFIAFLFWYFLFYRKKKESEDEKDSTVDPKGMP